jgi:hypothetical protein
VINGDPRVKSAPQGSPVTQTLSSEGVSQPFRASQRRLHCVGHILNLVAKKVLFGTGVGIDIGAECETAEEEDKAIEAEVSLTHTRHVTYTVLNRIEEKTHEGMA